MLPLRLAGMEGVSDEKQPDALDVLCQRLAIDRSPRIEQAVTHPSYANERSGQDHNQRLEFLGDAVLGLCVSELLMTAFPGVDEGALTVMRASLVNTQALAEAGREVDLGSALRLGRGADGAGERKRTNVLADAVEAIIAAVYLDQAMEAARRLTHAVVHTRLQTLVERGGIVRDPKSRLQELLQGRGLPAPTYAVVDTQGPPHARSFTIAVTFGTTPQSEGAALLSYKGNGRSKKLAEQEAARLGLAALETQAQPTPASTSTTAEENA